MSIITPDANGDNVAVYAAWSNGGTHMELYLRAVDMATLEAGLIDAGLKVADEDLGVVEARHVSVWDTGLIETSPAVYSTDGLTVVTPASYAPQAHVNVRIYWDALTEDEQASFIATAMAWTVTGVVTEGNKGENGALRNGVEMLDPASISSPSMGS